MDEQRILVVEDHTPLLTAIEDVLAGQGYTVSTATDGAEALQVMEKVTPDLIVADIMMPRMDGYAFYDAVRARPEWVPIPFIFLTAKAGKDDILKGKGLGVEDYLTKPFSPEELVVAVGARLGRARAIRETMGMEFDQLKQQIVTVLGHELRTPLTYVMGYTGLALEDLSSLTPDALQGFLYGIKKGADRLNGLLEELLLLLRLDTGQTAEEFAMLTSVRRDLGMILTRTVRTHVGTAVAKGVSLQTKVEPDLPPVKLCEPQFVDALGRLVDNGIKFSRGEGKQVTVSARATGDWVEVSVADEGVGIPAKEIPHLFERFRQIDRDRMEQQGVGLGLAIAHELIHLHNGEIVVESTPRQGSTFTVRLPVHREET